MNSLFHSLYLFPLSFGVHLGVNSSNQSRSADGGFPLLLHGPDGTTDIDWLFTWPPHPVWIATLAPIFRCGYILGREWIITKILGISESRSSSNDQNNHRRNNNGARRFLWDLEGFQARFDVVAEDVPAAGGVIHNHNGDPAGHGDVAVVADHHDPPHNEDAERDEVAEEADDINTIRVTGYSLGRLLGGALLMPKISSVMGSALLRIAKAMERDWLKRFLGLSVGPVGWKAILPPMSALRRMDPV